MNKFINSLLLFIFFPTMALTIFVGYDMPVEFLKTSGSQIPYRFEIFLVLGLIILIINVRRSIRRWMGMRLVNKIDKFKWNQPMTQERKKRVQVYNLLEAFVLLFVGLTLYYVSNEAWLPAIAFCFTSVDNIIFTLIGSTKNRFRAGITSKAVIIADRDVSLVYFSGLRKVTIHQDSIYFDYIKGLQLSFPVDCIAEKDQFFKVLEEQLDRDRVFITKER